MTPQFEASEAPPSFGQRRHWYVNVIGVEPDQLPLVAVSVWPTTGVPRMRGWPVGVGAVVGDASTPVGRNTAPRAPAQIAVAIALRQPAFVVNRMTSPCSNMLRST